MIIEKSKKEWWVIVKRFVVSIVLVITLVLAGCDSSKNSQGSETKRENLQDSIQTLTKAQKIEMKSEDSGTVVRTITKKEEVKTFIKQQRMDKWEYAGALPKEAKKQYEYIFSQEATVKPAEKEKNRELNEVARLITYKNIPYVTLKVSFINLNMKIPKDVAEYLNQN